MNTYDLWKTRNRSEDNTYLNDEEGAKCDDCSDYFPYEALTRVGDAGRFCEHCVTLYNRCDGCGERFDTFASEEKYIDRYGKTATERFCVECYGGGSQADEQAQL